MEKVENVEVEERFLLDNGLRRRQFIVAFCALVLCFTSCSQRVALEANQAPAVSTKRDMGSHAPTAHQQQASAFMSRPTHTRH